MTKESKEIAVRRRITNIYNKQGEDFSSLKEYNDYLEYVEDLIFNLIEGVNGPALEAEVAKYKEANAEQIVASKAKRAEELAAALRAQDGPSGGHPDQIEEVKTTQGDETVALGAATHYTPAIASSGSYMQPRPAGPTSQPVPLGQNHSSYEEMPEDEETRRIKKEKAAKAGGWTPDIGRKRACEEAFASLWLE